MESNESNVMYELDEKTSHDVTGGGMELPFGWSRQEKIGTAIGATTGLAGAAALSTASSIKRKDSPGEAIGQGAITLGIIAPSATATGYILGGTAKTFMQHAASGASRPPLR